MEEKIEDGQVKLAHFERLIKQVAEEDSLRAEDAFLLPRGAYFEMWLHPKQGTIALDYYDFYGEGIEISLKTLVDNWIDNPYGCSGRTREQRLEVLRTFLALEKLFSEQLDRIRVAVQEQQAYADEVVIDAA